MEKENSLALTRNHFSKEMDGKKVNVRLITSDGDIFEAVSKILKVTLVRYARANWTYTFRKTQDLSELMPEGCSCYEVTALSDEETEPVRYMFVATAENKRRIENAICAFDQMAEVKEEVR